MKELNIGVIGYGLRVGMIFAGLYKNELGVKVNLTAVCDPKGKDGLTEKLTECEIDFTNTRFYTDAEEMLDDEKLDGVMIGTRCNLHTDFAVMVLDRKIPLFLEKPVSINYEQYEKLKAAGERAESEVVVSFPLRITAMVDQVKDLIK